jgi:hypothetical protein
MAGPCNSAPPPKNKDAPAFDRPEINQEYQQNRTLEGALASAPGAETLQKTYSVMPVTERRAGSGMLAPSVLEPGVMKTIFVVMILAFAFTTGMAVTTIISQIVS